jgi:hypothetical protein
MIPIEQLNRTFFGLLCGVLALTCAFLVYLLFHPLDPFKDEKARMTTSQAILNIKELTASWKLENGPISNGLDNRGLLKMLTGGDINDVVRKALRDDIDWSGEIIDGWGTPLQIGTGRGAKVQIRSAGSDKIFGTPDDITSP